MFALSKTAKKKLTADEYSIAYKLNYNKHKLERLQ